MKSSLYDSYAREGAEWATVDDYEIVVSTAGPGAEYEAIRSHIGITDRSDMAKFKIKGEKAIDALESALTGMIANLPENAIRHTLMMDETGCVVTVVQVYNKFEYYMLTCARACRSRVYEQLRRQADGDVEIEDITDTLVAVCVEGPQSWEVPTALAGAVASGLPVQHFVDCEIGARQAVISRFGHTGEYGYIFFVPIESAEDLLGAIRGVARNALLCGRAIHDLLQLEVRSFNQYTDIPRNESPLQAGLHWMIGFRKESFQGQAAIMTEKASGLAQKMVGMKMLDKGMPVVSGNVYDGDEAIGYVANSGFSPRMDCGIALAYLKTELAWVGLTLAVDTDQGRGRAMTVSTPFFPTKSMFVRMT